MSINSSFSLQSAQATIAKLQKYKSETLQQQTKNILQTVHASTSSAPTQIIHVLSKEDKQALSSKAEVLVMKKNLKSSKKALTDSNEEKDRLQKSANN